MGRQSSRLIYKGKDHKDIYFQGHYHDAMYVGSELVWRKIKNPKWKFMEASELQESGEKILGAGCSFFYNGVSYIACNYSSNNIMLYYDRFSNKWCPSSAPETAFNVVCAENGLFVAAEKPSREHFQTAQMYVSRDGKTWNNIGYIEEKGLSSLSNSPLEIAAATNGNQIIAFHKSGGSSRCHMNYGSESQSGVWSQSEKTLGNIFEISNPSYICCCNNYLVGSSAGGSFSNIAISGDFGRTWTENNVFKEYGNIGRVSEAGGKAFIISNVLAATEKNLIVVNPATEDIRSALKIENYIQFNDAAVLTIIKAESYGLYCMYIQSDFYQSKDGYLWEKVEQDYTDSGKWQYGTYNQSRSAIFIPDVGYYAGFNNCIGFCKNPFDIFS